MEWYDFAVFGALAGGLAAVFLPPGRQTSALISVFAVFAMSFLARPVGALLMGVGADRRGRRPALIAMVLLMAGATGAIGLLPTWSAIGVAAPAVLVVLRLLQGFSSGGQITTSIAFLTEFAPDGRRGRYGGWHLATVAMGLALGPDHRQRPDLCTRPLATAQLGMAGGVPRCAAPRLGRVVHPAAPHRDTGLPIGAPGGC